MDNLNQINNTIQNTASSGIVNHQSTFILHSMIDSLSGWMKFIGIFIIIIGSVLCLGVITAAIGVPLIFSGIALIKGSKSIKTYKHYNSPYILNEVFTSINKYFKIQGILIIIGIILSIIFITFFSFASIIAFNNIF